MKDDPCSSFVYSNGYLILVISSILEHLNVDYK